MKMLTIAGSGGAGEDGNRSERSVAKGALLLGSPLPEGARLSPGWGGKAVAVRVRLGRKRNEATIRTESQRIGKPCFLAMVDSCIHQRVVS